VTAATPPADPLRVHAEITVEHPRSIVHAALADPQARAQWSASAEAGFRYLETAFVAGGRDVFECRGPGGTRLRGRVHYVDIVPGRRVVYDETLFDGATPVAAATVTILLEEAAPDVTRVVMAAQLHGEPSSALVAGYGSGLRAACAGLARWLDSGAGRHPTPSMR